jgi:hypothetical protein
MNVVVVLCFSDFGFDPLRLGEVPENLERFKESELIHCRWAMLAVVSISQSIKLFSDLLVHVWINSKLSDIMVAK